jgi:malonyl CoA-acyl carrier protein transacylase
MAADGKQTALVVCPGRGTYNAAELGYLRRHHARRAEFLDMVDTYRAAHHQPTVRELDDAKTYSPAVHARGDNASALIFACSFADFLTIDRDRFDIVAVTGNSMGWYTALACAGAVDPEPGLALVNTMGLYMQEASIGSQAIYALADEDWREIPGRRAALLQTIVDIHGHAGAELYLSIDLGGMLVVAGNRAGLDAMAARAPKGPGRFPLTLPNHAGFHSPLQAPVSERAKATIGMADFHGPAIPLIDGFGRIWRPHATDASTLWDYTLGDQVVETYDFTAAVQVSVKEFAPDRVIILGPGDTMGSAVAQSLIGARWRGLTSKAAFAESQARDPFLLAMGRDDQRALATGV